MIQERENCFLMKLKHRHIISISLLLCGLLGFISCNKESFKLSREEGEEKDNSVFLTFHTDVAGGFSRAGESEEGADEKIRQLLIRDRVERAGG